MSEGAGIRGEWRFGFRVQIVYVEPEFQMRNPHCPREFKYSAKYSEACSPQDAVARAMQDYEFCYANSSVGWRRVLKSITVIPCA